MSVKYFPLVWAALRRRPAETLLIVLSITAAFALFSLMIDLDLTTRQLIEQSRMDRLWVDPRFPDQAARFGLPLGLGGQLARIDGVVGVGASRWLDGYHVDPHDHVSILTVDEGMRIAWSEGPLTPADWNRLSATPSGIYASARAAKRWNLRPGDLFTVITGPSTRIDGRTSWDFVVLGIVADSREFSSADGLIIGNASFIDNALPLDQRGEGFFFSVAVRDPRRAAAIASLIDRRYANSATSTLSVPKRIDQQSSVEGGIDTAALTTAIAGAGLVMILTLTANVIARSVRERLPEFAVLETLGFRHAHLTGLVFVEATIPCLLGAGLGTALALLLGEGATRLLSQTLASSLSAPTPALSLMVWIAGSAVLLALASSAVPIVRLRYLSVSDALAGR